MNLRRRILLLILILLLLGGGAGYGLGIFKGSTDTPTLGDEMAEKRHGDLVEDPSTNNHVGGSNSNHDVADELGKSQGAREGDGDSAKPTGKTIKQAVREGEASEDLPEEAAPPLPEGDFSKPFSIALYAPEGEGDTPTITFDKEAHHGGALTFEGKFERDNDFWIVAEGKLHYQGPKSKCLHFPITIDNRGAKSGRGIFVYSPDLDKGINFILVPCVSVEGSVTIQGNDDPYPKAQVRFRASDDLGHIGEYIRLDGPNKMPETGGSSHYLVETHISLALEADEEYWDVAKIADLTVACAEDGSYQARVLPGTYNVDALHADGVSEREIDLHTLPLSAWAYEEDDSEDVLLPYGNFTLEQDEYESPKMNFALPLVSLLRFQVAEIGEFPIRILFTENTSSPPDWDYFERDKLPAIYADEAGKTELPIPYQSARVAIRPQGFLQRVFDLNYKAGEDVDLGTLKFERGATIKGVVQDEDGAPIPGVALYLGDAEFIDDLDRVDELDARRTGVNAPLFTPRWLSDAKGAFMISGIELGRATIKALYKDFPEIETELTILNADESVEITIVMRRAGTLEVEVVVPPELRVLILGVEKANDPTQSVWNSLSYGSRAEVVLLEETLSTSSPFAKTRVYERISGTETGKFVFRSVPNGDYKVYATLHSFSTPLTATMVKVGSTTSLTLALPKPARLHGTILGRDGKPFADQALNLFLLDEDGGLDHLPRGRTDTKGGYTFNGLPAGEILFRFYENGIEDAILSVRSRMVQLRESDDLRFDIDLSESYGISLDGAFTLNGKAAFTDAFLTKVNSQGELSRDADAEPLGHFVFDWLESGEYVLTLTQSDRASGGASRTSMLISVSDSPRDQKLSKDFRASRLSGSLLGSKEELSMEDVTLTLWPTHLGDIAASGMLQELVALSIKPDDDGSYDFPLVVDGEYTLSVVVQGKATLRQIYNHRGATHLDLSLPREEGASLVLNASELKGFDDGGNVSVFAELYDAKGNWVATSEGWYGVRAGSEIFDSTEKVTFSGLASGSYRLAVYGTWVEGSQHRFELKAGESKTLDISLYAAACLDLNVTNEEFSIADQVDAKVSLQITHPDGRAEWVIPPRSAYLMRDFRLRGLEAGGLRVQIEVPGYLTFVGDYEVKRSEWRTEKITLTKK